MSSDDGPRNLLLDLAKKNRAKAATSEAAPENVVNSAGKSAEKAGSSADRLPLIIIGIALAMGTGYSVIAKAAQGSPETARMGPSEIASPASQPSVTNPFLPLQTDLAPDSQPSSVVQEAEVEQDGDIDSASPDADSSEERLPANDEVAFAKVNVPGGTVSVPEGWVLEETTESGTKSMRWEDPESKAFVRLFVGGSLKDSRKVQEDQESGFEKSSQYEYSRLSLDTQSSEFFGGVRWDFLLRRSGGKQMQRTVTYFSKGGRHYALSVGVPVEKAGEMLPVVNTFLASAKEW